MTTRTKPSSFKSALALLVISLPVNNAASQDWTPPECSATPTSTKLGGIRQGNYDDAVFVVLFDGLIAIPASYTLIGDYDAYHTFNYSINPKSKGEPFGSITIGDYEKWKADDLYSEYRTYRSTSAFRCFGIDIEIWHLSAFEGDDMKSQWVLMHNEDDFILISSASETLWLEILQARDYLKDLR